MPDVLAALCSAHSVAPDSVGGLALFAALAAAGAGGSLVHCAPMCGPIVLGQAGRRLSAISAEHLCGRDRIRAGLLLPYHIGRLTTYAALGAVAAGLDAGVTRLAWFRGLSESLLILAAALFLVQAGKRLLPVPRRGGHGVIGGAVTRLAGRCRDHEASGRFGLGILLGFLPCGLVYAALAAAAGSGHAATGALAMLAFGIGTVPTLAVIGVAGHVVMARLGRFAALAAPAVMIFNAATVSALVWLRALG